MVGVEDYAFSLSPLHTHVRSVSNEGVIKEGNVDAKDFSCCILIS